MVALRGQRRRELPRELLRAVLQDMLDEVNRSVAACPHNPRFGLWRPCRTKKLVTGLELLAADTALLRTTETHRRHDPDASDALWSAYMSKQVAFQTRTGSHVSQWPQQPSLQQVDPRSWEWRMAMPVFDAADALRVVAVLSVEGDGAVTRPDQLEPYSVLETCERAVYLVRRIASVMERYD
jgi:hypothetical protein